MTIGWGVGLMLPALVMNIETAAFSCLWTGGRLPLHLLTTSGDALNTELYPKSDLL